jgi:ATP adenylyltransferase
MPTTASGSLFAPWRLDYIKGVSDGPKECFLCAAAKTPDRDEQNFVIARSNHCLLMLNKFPYVNGHLLVAPYRHESTLEPLTVEERSQIMELLLHGQKLLSSAMNPHGYNMGINIASCAGAGVPGHVHAHVVPRWNGDTNFMSVIGNVRVIPQALETAYRQLREAHEKILAP